MKHTRFAHSLGHFLYLCPILAHNGYFKSNGCKQFSRYLQYLDFIGVSKSHLQEEISRNFHLTDANDRLLWSISAMSLTECQSNSTWCMRPLFELKIRTIFALVSVCVCVCISSFNTSVYYFLSSSDRLPVQQICWLCSTRFFSTNSRRKESKNRKCWSKFRQTVFLYTLGRNPK